MEYIIHYDIAAILLLVAIMVDFFTKKTIRTVEWKVLAYLLLVVFSSSIFDLLSIYTITYGASIPIWINYVTNCLYLITFNACPLVYCWYVFVILGKAGELRLIHKLQLAVPFLLDVVCIMTTPLTHFIFYMKDGVEYTHGSGMVLLYISAVYYVITSLVYIVKNRTILSLDKRIVIYFFSIGSLLAVVAQFIFSELMITQFVVTLSALLMYMTLENPGYYLESDLNIFNNNAFETEVSRCVEEKKPFSVLSIQLSELDYIYDSIGAENTKKLIKKFVDVLQYICGNYMICRTKMNNFTVISAEEQKNWNEIIKEIRENVKTPFIVEGTEIVLKTHMMVVACPDDVQTSQDIYDLVGYYNASENTVYGLVRMGQIRREHKLVEILKRALVNGELEVRYQPIYDSRQQRYVSAKATPFLKNKELGYVSPEEFIPVAARYGIMGEIGEYVFREVCKFLGSHDIRKLGIESIYLNMSTAQLMQQDFYKKLVVSMNEYGLSYDMIGIELTETIVVSDKVALKENMEKLRELDVKFVLEHYGTGFSNISTVVQYPIDTIKIDKSWLESLENNSKAVYAVKHFLSMCAEMHMNVVAEGIETKEQMELLSELGYDYFQGDYYAKPMNGEVFIREIG